MLDVQKLPGGAVSGGMRGELRRKLLDVRRVPGGAVSGGMRGRKL